MSLDTRVSELIKRIYTAGDDRTVWDAILVDLLQYVGACAGIASLIDFKQNQLLMSKVYGPQHNGYHLEGYGQRYRDDPTLAWAARNPGARFCDSRRVISRDQYPHQPFVQWAYTTLGSSFWHSGCASAANGLSFCLAAHFSHVDSELPDAGDLFRLLFEHVECALRLSTRSFSEESARALLRLNDVGHVEQISRGAQRLLKDRAPIAIIDKRPIVTTAGQQNLVDRALEQAIPKRNAVPKATAIQLKHEHGRPWNVIFRPVTANYGPFGNIHRKVDVELLDRIPEIAGLEIIQSLFDLTGRELQVLRLVAQGHSIDSLSATIEVSRNTTRAHLRSIYAKTKTNSQAELMHLCSGLSSATGDIGDTNLECVN